jgi:hypothetical protein
MPPRFSFSTELNIKCECTICPVRLAQAVLYISTLQGRKEGKAREIPRSKYGLIHHMGRFRVD